MTDKTKGKATYAARAGGGFDEASGGIVPPLQPSTTFVRNEDYDLHIAENSYGRDNNDQVRLAEQILCTLEGAQDSLLFSTGMAAISSTIGVLKRGQTLILQEGIYWGTTHWVRAFCKKREVNLVEVDSSNQQELASAISNHKPDMVFVETPSNPWLKVTDVVAAGKLAKEAGAILVVDATAATPCVMQPLELGADLVVHSATKAINGHSDVLAGLVSTSDKSSDIWQQIMADRHAGGAILSAHSAWMLIRGMRTLPLRVERMCQNAIDLANYLEGHDKIEAVWYPGLVSNPGHEIAKAQMNDGFGYLLSFLVKGGKQEALTFCRHIEGIHRATSLGGTESLIEHRHTIEGELTGVPENLIRLSVGIEDVADLKSELDAALQRI